jgi:hypothetical protein
MLVSDLSSAGLGMKAGFFHQKFRAGGILKFRPHNCALLSPKISVTISGPETNQKRSIEPWKIVPELKMDYCGLISRICGLKNRGEFEHPV